MDNYLTMTIMIFAKPTHYIKKYWIRLTLICGIFLLSLLSLLLTKTWFAKKPLPIATIVLNIQALDPSGLPVSGAKISLDGTLVGFTGAFGDWEGQVSLTQTRQNAHIQVEKAQNKKIMGGTTILNVAAISNDTSPPSSPAYLKRRVLLRGLTTSLKF